MSRKYKFHDQDKLYFISFVPNGFGMHSPPDYTIPVRQNYPGKQAVIDVIGREEYLKTVLNSWSR